MSTKVKLDLETKTQMNRGIRLRVKDDVRQSWVVSIMQNKSLNFLGVFVFLFGLFLAISGVTVKPAYALDTSPGDGILFYAATGNTTPQHRFYTNSVNTFAANAGTVAGAQPAITVVKTSPTRQEAIAAYQDTSGNLRVLCYDGTTWTQDWTIAVAAAGTPTTRRFDIAYETTTGDVTVAYSRNTAATNALAYRTKAGSLGCGSANWSVAANFPTGTVATSATVTWVKAARNGVSGSNMQGWVWLDNAATQADLGGAMWDGSAFTNFRAIETSMEHVTAVGDHDAFDIQFESLSGDFMVVWSNSAGASAANGYRWSACTGGTSACTWSAASAAFNGGGGAALADDALSIDLSSDPLSDRMAMAGVGTVAVADVSAAYWSGTAWTGYANVDTTAEGTAVGMKTLTTGWLNNNGNKKWYLSYDDASGTGLSYKFAIDGGALTSPTDHPAPAPALNDIRGRYDTDVNPHNPSELIQTLSDNTNAIWAFRLSMDTSGNLSWNNMNGASLGTKPSHPQQGFHFQYWRYIPPTTISGTCHDYDQTTACANGVGTVKVAVDGVVQAGSDATFTSGAWSLDITKPASGASIIVYLDGAADADEATAVTLYDGSGNINNIVLYKQQVTIGANGGLNPAQLLTRVNMDDWDATNDEDIFYDVITGTATCNNVTSFTGICIDSNGTSGSSSQEKLQVMSGNTLTPLVSIITHDLVVASTATFNTCSCTYTISGSWTNLGTVNNLGTITFTSTSLGETITSGGSSFQGLSFNGVGGGWTLLDSTTIASLLTITNGNFNAGTGTTLTLSGTGTPFANSGTFTPGTSTVVYTGNGATVTPATYYNLEAKPSSSTAQTLGGCCTYTGTSFDTQESGNFDPLGITAYNDFFWIVDFIDDDVYKYNSDGTYTGTSFDIAASGNTEPFSITAYNDFFWIVDGTDDEVYKYNSNGTYTSTSFDTAASGNTDPHGIVAYNDFFWITDFIDDRVYKYNSSGTYTGTSFDIAASGNANSYDITAFNDFLWIADDADAEIYKYNPDGTYTGFSFDTATSGNISPSGLAYYNNYFWTVYYAEAEVYKFAASNSDITINNNLVIGNGTNAGATAQTNINVAGTVTIAANATLSAGSNSFTIGNDFVNGGTFTAGTSTVTFNNSSNVTDITGTNTFYNFAVNTPGKTVRFTQGTTTTIASGGSLTVNGGSGNNVIFTSVSGAATWAITHNAAATESITNLTVNWGACTASSDITMGAGSTKDVNSGACWVVPISITISGTVYTDEGTTNIGVSKTVVIKVNGAGSYTDETDASGVYSIPSVAAASNAVVTIYLDGETENANTVTISTGSNLTNIHLYQNRVIIRDDNGAGITNDNLDTYDADNEGDGDLMFTATQGLQTTLSIADGYKLFIWTQTTYNPGGDITTSPSSSSASTDGDFYMATSTVMDLAAAYSLYIGGDYHVEGQVNNIQAITFTANSTGHTIDTEGIGTPTTTFDGVGGGWSFIETEFSIDGDFEIANGTVTAPTVILSVYGTYINNGVFLNNNGAVVLSAISSSSMSGTLSGANGKFYDLAIGNNGDFSIAANLEIVRHLTLSTGGAVTAPASGTITVGGNFSDGSGTGFDSNGGTLILNSATTANITTGSTLSLHNLTVNTPGKTVVFQTGKTFYIGGLLNVNGGSGNNVIFTSSDTSNPPTTNWIIDHQGTESITYLTVNYGSCYVGAPSSTLITMGTGSTKDVNSGACWEVPFAGITVGGTVYSGQGTGPLASKTIVVRVNNTASFSADTNGSGVYSIANVTANSNDVITVFIDDETENATTVGVSNGSDVSDFHLYQNTLIVRYATGSSITNTTLDTYDYANAGSDGDVLHTVTSSNLTLNDGAKILVWTGKTYAPGGTVTTSVSADGTDSNIDGDVEIMSTATMSMSTNALSIGGDFTNAGTFSTSANPGVIFTATATGHTIDNGTGNLSFITFNGTGGGWSFSDASNTVGGDITMTAGTLSGTTNLIVAGGDITGDGDINLTGGTVIVDGNSGTGIGGSTDWDFYNLTLGSADGFQTHNFIGSGSITIANEFNIPSTETFNAGSKTIIFSGTSGTQITGIGTLNEQTSIMRFTGNGAIIPTISGGYYILELMPSGASAQVLTSGTLNVSNNLVVGNGTNAGATGATNNPTVNVGGVMSIATAANYTTGTGTLTFSGTGTPLARTGTFTATDGNTVVFTGAGVTSITSSLMISGNSFYNLTINGSGTINSNSGITVKNEAVVLGGAFSVNGTSNLFVGNSAVNNSGSIKVASTSSLTMGTGTVTMVSSASGSNCIGSTGASCAGTAGTLSLYRLTIGNGTIAQTTTFGGTSPAMTISNLFTIAANATFDGGSGTINLSGTSTPFVKTGSFTPNTSTLNYIGNSATNITAATYYNLGVKPGVDDTTHTFLAGSFIVNGNFTAGNGTNTGVIVNANSNEPTLDVNGNVSIVANTTFNAPTSNPMTVGGSWTNSGTFTHLNGTVTFDGTGTNNITTGGVNGKFYNVIFNNAGDTWSLQDNMSVEYNLTITAGNLNANSTTITLEGNGCCDSSFTNNDTFTQGTSTVKYVAGAANITALNGSSTTNAYYNLELGTAADTSSVTYSSTGDTTVNGTITIGNVGSTGSDTLLLSSHTWTSKKNGPTFDLTGGKGNLNSGTSTVIFNFSGGSMLTNDMTGTNAFYNLTYTGFGLSIEDNNFAVKNTLTIANGAGGLNMGTADLTVGDYTIPSSGNIKVASTATLSQSVGGDTTIMGGLASSNCIGANGANCSGTAGSIGFGNLIIDASGAQITTFGGTSPTMNVSDTLTVQAGATFEAGSGTINLNNTGTPFVNNGTFTPNTSTVNYIGAGATNITATNYFNLGVKPAANNAIHTLEAGDLNVGGTLTIGNGTNTGVEFTDAINDTNMYLNGTGTSIDIKVGSTFRASTSAELEIAGSWANAGTFIHNSGTIIFNTTSSGKTIQSNGSSFNHINFNSSNSEGGWSPTDAMVLAGDMTLVSGTLSGSQNVTVNGGDVTGGSSGNINMTGGTFLIDGTGNYGNNLGSSTFNNLTFGNGTGAETTTILFSPGITVSGVLTIAANQTVNDASASVLEFTGAGTPFVINGTYSNTGLGSLFKYTSTTGVTALANTALTGTKAPYELRINNASGVFNAGVAIEARNALEVQAGTLAMGANNLTVGSTGIASSGRLYVYSDQTITQDATASTTILAASGTSCIGASGFSCTGAPGSITLGDLILGDGTTTFTTNLAGTTPTLTVDSITVNALNTFNAGTASIININGNETVFTTTGTFSAQTSTINFNSVGTTGTTIPAATYYNIAFNKASNIFTAAGAMTIGNDFTLSAGRFIAPATTLTINGDFTNNSADSIKFGANGGTVVFNPSFNNETSVIGGTGNTTFNNLTNTNTGSTLQFANGRTIAVTGTMTMTGASGNPIRLHSDSAGAQWLVNFSNTTNPLFFVYVRDGACSGGSTLTGNNRLFDQGNNGDCWGFIRRGIGVGNGPSGGGAGGSGGTSGGGAGGGNSSGTTATATATVVGNSVTAIQVNSGGSNYPSAPIISVCAVGAGSGATAIANMSGSTVNSITVTNGGSGYTSGATVAIASPASPNAAPGCGGTSGGGSGGGGGGSP